MTNISEGPDLSLVTKQMMAKFAQKIGQKDEPLIWGVKSSTETLKSVALYVNGVVDGKKIRHSICLTDQPVLKDSKAPGLKSLREKTVVFVPHGDTWDQASLLSIAIQIATQGSKMLIGFTDPAALSLGIYQFLVSQQIDNSGHLSAWSVNMSIPLRNIQ